MLALLSLLGLTLAVSASPLQASASATSSAVLPNPSQVYINGITYGGTGCPQGSLSSFISADRQTFTLIFDEYVASIGPGVPITENRKNCQLDIDLQYPSGFQYSVFSADYRGYALLDTNVTGTQQSTYYFSGQSQQVSTSSNFKGPMDSDYLITDNVPFSSVVWSPCGASLPLNINSQVRLVSKTPSASGQITDDSIDGHIDFIIGLMWQKC